MRKRMLAAVLAALLLLGALPMAAAAQGLEDGAAPLSVLEDGTDPQPGEDGTDPQPGEDGTDPQPGEDGAESQPSEDGTDPQPGEDGADPQPGEDGAESQPGEDGTEDDTEGGTKPLPELETENHIAYIEGSGDMVEPESRLTRAAAAKIVCTLLRESGAPAPQAGKGFPDVPAGAWFAPHVEKLAGLGILQGRTDGTFGPNDSINRAEFVQMLARFFEPVPSGIIFIDVPEDHWAYEAVSTAVEKGWTTGYGDGTFAPGRPITRAEAVTMMNRVLGRAGDQSRLDADGKVLRFLDLPFTHWAYYQIMEAALPHVPLMGEAGETWESYTIPASQRGAGPQYYDGETYYVDENGLYVRGRDVGVLHFTQDGRYTSGDGELDAQLRGIAKSRFKDSNTPVQNLRIAYEYIGENYGYRANTYLNDGDAGWENSKAKEMIRNRKGNCYNFAALMTVLARRLGYQSRAYSGWFKASF